MVKSGIDILGRILSLWVRAIIRFAPFVLVVGTGITGLLFFYTVNNLGISTDTADMLSESVHFRRFHNEYKREFPQYNNTMLIVIDGETPDIAHDAATALASRLKNKTGLFRTIYFPAGDKFFQEHALLYLSRSELEDLADNLAKVQPFLARLTRDQSLRGLCSMIHEAVQEVLEGEDIDLSPLFKRLKEALAAVLHEKFHELSWLELMRGGRSEPDDRRSFVVVQPRLDYSALIPAKAAVHTVRKVAEELKLNADNGIRLRITGDVALEYEEMQSVSHGSVLAGTLALVLVGVVLFIGLGSPRLVFCTLVTLVIGLIWTAGFATAAVGHLNMISIAFGVLYIGLGVDYAIHFCLRYKELIREGHSSSEAISLTAEDVGSSLVLCACTTAIAFYAFIPTVFAGVAELGMISGTGMFIGLFVTMTILPALLSLMPLHRKFISDERSPGRFIGALISLPARHAFAIRTGTLIAGVVVLLLLPHVTFDRNTLNLRDPESESVSTFRELLTRGKASPWSLKILARDAHSAGQYKTRLALLETVDKALILDDFVPDKQDEKLSIVEEIALIMGPARSLIDKEEPPAFSEKLAALGDLEAILTALLKEKSNSSSIAEARRLLDVLKLFKARLDEQGEPSKIEMLKRLEGSLFASLPERLRELRASLSADRITRATLPEDLVRRWVSDKGYHLVEVFPREDLNDDKKMMRFIEEVREVAPDAIGYPVIILEAGDAVVTAFQQAFFLSLIAISVLLIILMKRKTDAFLVILLLLLAGGLTGAVSVLCDMPFNFANVIALPLILGIGVDSGIHMIRRRRKTPPANGYLLKTSTSRAVLFSGLTTISGFGNLALATHPGMASMGRLLTLGIAFTLVCSLVILPTLVRHD